jgi:hypothetical protein
MTTRDFTEILHTALAEGAENINIRTFARAGILGYEEDDEDNAGLVVQIDGAEFQVIIVQSR